MSRLKAALALAAVLATSAVSVAHAGAHHHTHSGARIAMLKAAPAM